jgi:pectate lyase
MRGKFNLKLGFNALLVLSAAIAIAQTGCGDESSKSSSSASAAVTETWDPTLTINGWATQGTGTTGGESAPSTNVYVVSTRAQLVSALTNLNSPTYATNPSAAKIEPKIIYIKGTIYGTDLGDGTYADEAYYVKNSAKSWNFDEYCKSFDPDYLAALKEEIAAGSTTASAELALINKQGSQRTTLKSAIKNQVKFSLPSNTSIYGVGSDAKIIDGYFEVNAATNIIIRNLEMQAVQDWSAAWTPSDGTTGNWNANFKCITIVTGTYIWIDHCTFSDGSHPDSDQPVIFGKHVQRHDGLVDPEDGSDYITVSYTIFANHDKTFMIGSGDGKAARDSGKNHFTFTNNLFDNAQERGPRVRFGQVHLYNNYYRGKTYDEHYPMTSESNGGASYFIGMGIECMILSESNTFEYNGTNVSDDIILYNFKGNKFKDSGSWFNDTLDTNIETLAKTKYETYRAAQVAAGITDPWVTEEYTNDIGWTPPYTYTVKSSSSVNLKNHIISNAGAGKLSITAPSASVAD